MYHFQANASQLPQNILPPVEKINKPTIKRLVQKCAGVVDDINFSYLKEIWDPNSNGAISEQEVASICGVISTNQIIGQACDNFANAEEFFHQHCFDEIKISQAYNDMVKTLNKLDAKSPGYEEPVYFSKLFDKPLPLSTSKDREPDSQPQPQAPLTGAAALSAIKDKSRNNSGASTASTGSGRGRSDSLKRIRNEKKSEEEKLRAAGEKEKKLETQITRILNKSDALNGIARIEASLKRFEARFLELDQAKSDIRKNAEKIEKVTTLSNKNEDRIKKAEDRLDVIESNGNMGTGAHEFHEYFQKLDRESSTKNSVTLLARNLDFLTPVDMIKTFELNGKAIELNDKTNTFEISAKKVLKYLESKLELRIDWVRIAGTPKWRNKKLCIPLQFMSPYIVRDILEQRLKLKIDKVNSKNNASLNRTIQGGMQRCHNLLSEMKKNGKVKDCFISKAGFVNFTVVDSEADDTEVIRTVLDANEVLYFYKSGEVSDPDVLRALNKNEFFVNTKIELSETPARFRPNKDRAGRLAMEMEH